MEFLVEFLAESIIQGLVSEDWEEQELWDLEENHLNQVPGFWGPLEQALEESPVLALGQVSGPFQGQEVWCLVQEPQELCCPERGQLQLTKLLPKPGSGLVDSVVFLVLELVELVELVESLVSELVASLVVLLVLVALVA